MINKNLLLGMMMLFVFSGLCAQVKFSGNPGLISRNIDGLLSIHVSNSSAAVLPGTITIRVTEDNSGLPVINIQMDRIGVTPGTTSLGSFREHSVPSFFDNQLSRIAKSIGALPPGEYMICCEFDPEDKQFPPAEHCFLNVVAPRTPLLLIGPVDSICDRRPTFSWQGRKISAAESGLNVLCVEVRENQSAEEALQNNPPVLSQTVYRQASQVAFPAGASSLKEGKKYAWQVAEIAGGSLLNSSETGEFTVGCQDTETPGPESFAEVKAFYTGRKYYFTSTINFSFSNPYSAKKLRYSIMKLANREKLSDLPPLDIKPGLNQLSLPVSELKGLEKGAEYKIEIYNLGNAIHYINFIIKE